MFYPASRKKITVDQSKVLKKSTVPFFFGPPGIYIGMTVRQNILLQILKQVKTPPFSLSRMTQDAKY